MHSGLLHPIPSIRNLWLPPTMCRYGPTSDLVCLANTSTLWTRTEDLLAKWSAGLLATQASSEFLPCWTNSFLQLLHIMDVHLNAMETLLENTVLIPKSQKSGKGLVSNGAVWQDLLLYDCTPSVSLWVLPILYERAGCHKIFGSKSTIVLVCRGIISAVLQDKEDNMGLSLHLHCFGKPSFYECLPMDIERHNGIS